MNKVCEVAGILTKSGRFTTIRVVRAIFYNYIILMFIMVNVYSCSCLYKLYHTIQKGLTFTRYGFFYIMERFKIDIDLNSIERIDFFDIYH